MWRFFYDKKYLHWSILGTILIIAVTYYKATIDVQINNWFGVFYDFLQETLKGNEHNIQRYYDLLMQFLFLAGTYVLIATITDFYIRHWIFRWRKSMNDYYVSNWHYIHDIEGASQRIQEDCRLFSSILEGIGLNIIRSIFTLILFVPLLISLGDKIPSLFFENQTMKYELLSAAVLFALIGTIGLALVGIKLPGLQFNNQKVEAKYRKHLVYAEDQPEIVGNETILLFEDVKKNYFKIFFHYSYFDIVKWSYLQFGVLVPYLILGPALFDGVMTLGLLQAIVRAFGKIESSLQVFVNMWGTVVEFLSVYKRLRQFEKKIEERKLNGKMGTGNLQTS